MSQLQVTGEAKIRAIQGPVVANSGVITALDGEASQYVRGDGTLADFPTSSGGGSSVSYYLNSSVSQGTIGGVAYRELSKEPIIGAGTDIAISANGYVASYLTDANDPDVILIPGGNFNCEFYFSVNNNTGNPFFYAELYKYDGTTFTLLGSSVGVPEYINQGTVINPYYFAIPVATAALALTDRLAIRIYVNVDGRTITLHTENGHLCQVVTTLSKGMVSLNNLTDQSQFLTTGTSGTNFAIVSSGDTHTFNLPIASATNTGKLSSTDWSVFNNKQAALSFTAPLVNTSNTISIPAATSLVDGYLDNLDWVKFNTAYNDSIISAAVTGTTTKTLTLTQQDAGTITASWTDDNTDAVTSVFGRTGAVVATSGDYNTSQVTENTNLYFTDARSRAALSFAAGSGAYNSTTGVITIPTNTNQLTNGASFITLASLSAGTGISYNNTTGAISSTITQYTDALARAAISLTTTGSSGAATYNSTTGVFNIPNYGSALSGYLPLTGGTLTGTLTGTNGRFSGDMSIGTTTAPLSPLQVVGTGTIVTLGEQSGTTGKQLIIDMDSITGRSDIQSIWHFTAYTNLSLQKNGGKVLIGTITDNGSNSILQVAGNSTITGSLQVVKTGTIFTLGESSGTTGKQLLIGIDATSGRSELQSVWQGTGFTPLALQPSGGNVLIGTTTDNGAKLQVNGDATFSSSVTASSFSARGASSGYNIFRRDTDVYAGGWYSPSGSILLDVQGVGTALAITSGGDVAIGTATTTSIGSYRTLTIQGGNTSNGGLIQLQNSDSTCKAYWFSTNNASTLKTVTNHQLIFGANNTDYLYLTTSGNVGIGTSSPSNLLHVSSTSGTLIKLQGSSTGNNTNSIQGVNGSGDIFELGIANAGYVNSSYPTIVAKGAYLYSALTLGLIADGSSPILFQTGGSERMRITSSGDVAIGTSTPLLTASGRGSLTINGSSSSLLTFGIAGAYSGYIYSTGTILELDAQGSRNMGFNTNGQVRMTITSGGNVGIGTSSPTGNLEVSSAASTVFFRVGSTSSGNAGTFDMYSSGTGGFQASTVGFNTGNSVPILFSIGATERMRITSGGSVLIATTTDNGQGKLQVNGAITATNISYSGELVTNSTTFNTTYYHIISTAASSGQTYTLPNPSSNNLQYVIINKSIFSQTISAGSGFTIYDMAGNNSATITLAAKARCYIIADGSGFYQIF